MADGNDGVVGDGRDGAGSSPRADPDRGRIDGAVAREVGAIERIGSAVAVTGPYEVIAVVEAASIDALGKMVISHVQDVRGIARTLTCPVVHI
jgi:Lrp/AsnC ligand binding domain